MMHWISSPILHPIRGSITLPGDKSISHRALFFGAIAEGETHIQGFSNGEDCLRTLRIFQQLGIQMVWNNTEVNILGSGKYGLQAANQSLDCGNSGTTLRILMGLLAGQRYPYHLIGDESLQRRPMARVSDPLIEMGAQIKTTEGKAPIWISPSQGLKGITYTLPYASAQLKTALLFAGLYADGATQIIEPITTRDHSERMFVSFGAPLNLERFSQGQRLTIQPDIPLQGTQVYIPGDFSSAAFFIVAATLLPNAQVKLIQVGVNPTRLGLLDILKWMGADITLTNQTVWNEEPVADIDVRSAALKGIPIPPDLVPSMIDEFPILCIAAAVAEGETQISQATELRHKESDRLHAMACGLKQLGIDVSVTTDGMTINGGTLRGGIVDSFGDHRIAMAFAIAGCIAQKPVKVLNCEAVSTSFPSFLRCANQLQLLIRESYESNNSSCHYDRWS